MWWDKETKELPPKTTIDRYWKFIPESDITAHELAVILSKLSGMWLNSSLAGEIVDNSEIAIPENLRRHFKTVQR